MAILSEYNSQNKCHRTGYNETRTRLDTLNKELANARRLMLKDEITSAEYREIKNEYKPEIDSLEVQLSNYSTPITGIDNIVNKAIDNISRLDCLYEKGTIIEKREIVSSIFPEKLTFDGFNYQTPHLNKPLRLMSALNTAFHQKKKGHSSFTSETSPLVTL